MQLNIWRHLAYRFRNKFSYVVNNYYCNKDWFGMSRIKNCHKKTLRYCILTLCMPVDSQRLFSRILFETSRQIKFVSYNIIIKLPKQANHINPCASSSPEHPSENIEFAGVEPLQRPIKTSIVKSNQNQYSQT